MKWRWTSPVDSWLLLMAFTFAMIGLVFVLSATAPFASRDGNPYRFLISQLLYVAIGGLLCAILSYIPPRWLQHVALPAYLMAVLLMLLPFTPLGIVKNGAARWVYPGFQPSEFAKLALILMLARCIAGARDWAKQQYDTFAACMILTIIMCTLCLAQRDLGSAILMFCFGLIALLFAGVNGVVLSVTGGLAFAAALGFARLADYRWERIMAFLHPTRDPDNTGYQIARMLCAVARGGIIGPGPGLSREKWLGIPAIEADAIFCVIAGELGFIGAAALVGAFFYFAYRTVRLAQKQPDLFSGILMATLGCAITFQAFVNMGVATGCVPCTGLTLPFISHGGSSLVATLVAVGMLLSLSRQSASEGGEA